LTSLLSRKQRRDVKLLPHTNAKTDFRRIGQEKQEKSDISKKISQIPMLGHFAVGSFVGFENMV
jgi:hypothetical protein